METSKKITMAVVCTLLAGVTAAASPRIIYVDDDATGADNGSSWTNAYRYLQDALTSAAGTSVPVDIHVAQGTYKPDQSSSRPEGTKDRFARFALLNNVAILGGFAGAGASDPDARDIALHETILSGDLAGDDAPVSDACDLLTEPTRAENSIAIVYARSTSRSAILDGFTITAGNGHGAPRGDEGAGLHLSGTPSSPCGPSIRSCTFIGNLAGSGAAVAGYRMYPEITNCRFMCNAATGEGGALVVNSDNSRSLEYRPVVSGCTFIGNYAKTGGGATIIGYGTILSIEDCAFAQNTSPRGGALFVDSGTGVNVANCLFLHNGASGGGGAVYFSTSRLTMISCSLFGNTAPQGAAIACFERLYEGLGPRAKITNMILRDGGDEIYVPEATQMDATYSDIQGGWPGQGNIDTDPCFATPGYRDPNGTLENPNDDFWVEGDYHLKSQAGRWDPNSQSWVVDEVTSPCIDAGDPDSSVVDEPQPNGGRINMGAYGGTVEASKSL